MPSLQIVLHRIAWSAVIVGALPVLARRPRLAARALAKPHAWWMLALSGVLIGFNWGLYIWAVNAGHVVESSLGYFINPLLNVVLGVVFLRERLGRVQWVSVAHRDARRGVADVPLRPAAVDRAGARGVVRACTD